MTNKTSLVWATPNGDAQLAHMARVSNPDASLNMEGAKLIQYLIDNKHWSPLEMVDACVCIETTRDIGRQILRHRSFSFQEFSGRYQSYNKLNAAPLKECRMQDSANRQNSLDTATDTLKVMWETEQQRVLETATAAYKWALDAGIAKEQARAVLPEGLTPSRMYMKGSLRSWIHYIKVRTDKSTQKEHREIAEEICSLLHTQFPNAMRAAML